MTPLRAKMIRDMQLQRLAPKTQKAYVTAVAGLAKFYQCSPDRLRPEQIRTYLHHLLVERRLAGVDGNFMQHRAQHAFLERL